MKALTKTNEIKTVFGIAMGTTRGKIMVGKLYQIGFGEVHLQVFKGKLEGIASYGVLQDGSINLTNPIGIDFSRILVWNKEKKGS